MRHFLSLALGLITIVSSGCSTGRVGTDPEISKLQGKKVALVELDGEPNARAIVEVALVNQLVKRGSFILISEKDVMKSRAAPDQDPTDWKAIAKNAGAEYALRGNILEFSAEQSESYSAVEEPDSQLEAETGKQKAERIVKIKTLEGAVRVQLEFADLERNPDQSPLVQTGVAEHNEKITTDPVKKGPELPPRLRFLENLTNEAFRKFFERYN